MEIIMRYGIVISLDYISSPEEPVKHAYLNIQNALEAEGFKRDGRLFIIDCSASEGQLRARRAIESVEAQRYKKREESIYPYIKEFFGFELCHTTNLLLPPSGDISVTELSNLEGIEGVEVIELTDND